MSRRRDADPVCNVTAGLRRMLVPISELSADPANLRVHGPRSIDAIAASFRRFGQQKPIVVDANGVTVAGAGQLAAAAHLGWTHIAAVRSELTGVERIGYAIADNRSAELSTWDEKALAATLNEMNAGDLESLGFTAGELTAMGEAAAGAAVQDEIPEPPAVAVSRTGDLWLLGEHRLLVGDCTARADVERVMGRRRAHLVATDPPYLVGYDGTNHPQSFTGGENKDWSATYGTTWDENDGDSTLYRDFIALAAESAASDQAAWYIWHASRRQALLEAAMVAAGLLVHCQIVWVKNRPVLTRTWYMWQHEPCLMGWKKGNKPEPRSQERLSTVWSIDTIPNGPDRPEHPTPKPIEVYSTPISQHTTVGQWIYEPFAGSGTAIIAAEQLGRRCAAIEKQPVYVDVCIERWQKLTGKKARLDGSGTTFEAARASRLEHEQDAAIAAGEAGAGVAAAVSAAAEPVARRRRRRA